MNGDVTSHVTCSAGAFLIAYIVMIFLIGMPLLLLEFSFGQFFATGSLTIFRKVCPLFQGSVQKQCRQVSVTFVLCGIIKRL